jgi:4-hydroxyphenylpyruvate dioxygenase-like putative hemolysin
MSDDESANDTDETKSTTFTYKPETERQLLELYPHALGFSEALRMAISDAQLIRQSDIKLVENDDEDDD